jgi:glycosyltransferase involved in cell wall biosynthesis
MSAVKILTFTTLYPSAAQPRHGIFVEQRLRRLAESGQAQTCVVAPVPWFPFSHVWFGSYAAFATVPRHEERYGIHILHPRFILLPKVGMTLAPFFLAAAMIPVVRQIIRGGYDFDIIDAHYFYPDGIAATLLGKIFKKPVVITARGTDLNLIPRYWLPRRMILWAARRASRVITVCRALKDVLIRLGMSEDEVTVLRNGVDLQLFHPVDREEWRARCGLTRTTLLSVGHLIKRKGHDVVIQALSKLPTVELLIAGDGEEENALKSLAQSCGVANRVRFLGAIKQDLLKNYYGAVDALVLASSREGWANVLLEAMACGTPVVASNVWGTPEVVAAPEAGVLMRERTPEALAQAVRQLLENYPDRAATRRYAERFSWDDTTRGQLDIFSDVVKQKAVP